MKKDMSEVKNKYISLFCVILSVLIICNFTQVFAVPLLTWAENTNNKDTLIYSCDTYDLEYTVVDNEVIILGHNNTLNNDNLVDLEIPSIINGINVVAIGENAFKNCTNIKTITFPSTVKVIGKEAFRGCIGLDSNTELNLGNISILMGDCFSECTSLQKIYLPKDLYCNSSGSFKNCNNLYDIRFEEGITKIPDYLFEGCTGIITLNSENTENSVRMLSTTNIPNTVKEIGNNSFKDCTNLEYIGRTITYTKYEVTNTNYISSSSSSRNNEYNFIEIIGDNAFSNCSKLSNITFPQSLKQIGNSAFYGCNFMDIEFENKTSRFDINWKYDSFTNTNDKVQNYFNFIKKSSIEYDKKASNELLYYNINYNLNDDVNIQNIGNLVMYVSIPKSLDVIIEKTTLNENPISTKTTLSKANELIIDLSNFVTKEGIIQIAVIPSQESSSNNNISGYIKLDYNQNTHKCYLDSYLLTEDRVNLYTNNKTTNGLVTVNGVVNTDNLSNSYVDIYVNKKFVSQATIDSYGTFVCDIDLSSTEEESTSTIYAKYNNIKSNSLEIKYTKEPVSYIKSIVLNLSGKDHDITNSFLYGTSPLFSTVPSAQYYFVLDIINSNLLSSVIVTSTKNGETKYFTADYDSTTQKWYTELTKISDYLPGDLNILITYKDKISPYTENGSLKNDFFNTNNMDPFTLNNLNQVAESLENNGINMETTQINDVLSINENGKEGNSIYNRVVLNIDEEELVSTMQMSSYNTSISNTLSETDISSIFGTNLSDTKLQELKQITYLDILNNSEQYGFIKVKCENNITALGKITSSTYTFDEMKYLVDNGYIEGVSNMGEYIMSTFSDEDKTILMNECQMNTEDELVEAIINKIYNSCEDVAILNELVIELMSMSYDVGAFTTIFPFVSEDDNSGVGQIAKAVNVVQSTFISPILTTFPYFKGTDFVNPIDYSISNILSPYKFKINDKYMGKYTNFMGYLSAGINVADMIDDTWHIQNNDSFSTAQKVLLHTGNIAVGIGSIALCLAGTSALYKASKWILWNVLVVSNPTAIAIGSIILLLLATYQLSKWENNLDNIIYNDENNGANLRWSVDPSGIVYKVNSDDPNDKTNVLENVEVRLLYKDNINVTDNKSTDWDSSPYEQDNPLYTDKYGSFSWNTPEGCYQVVCKNTDYCVVRSPWFVVPPEKTDLNIGMIKPEFFTTPSNKEFSVENIIVDNNAINIQFNNYVEMSSLAKYITLTDEIGNLFNYNITYNDYLYELGSNSYTKQITISIDSIENVDKLILIISNKLKNYSNIELEQSYTKIIYFEDGQLSGHTYQNAIISLNHEKELYNLPINLNIKVIAKDEDNNILSTDIYCYDDLQVYGDDTSQKIFKIPQFDNAVYNIELYNNDFLITTIGDSELSKNDTNYNGKLDKWINLFDKTIIDKETHTQIPYQLIFTPAIEEIPITINLSTYVDGDVDLDGNLTAHDELLLKKYVLGLYNIIQTGSTDGITINKNGGNCNNIAINGDISTNGHLTFLSWNGNINGELNSIEEPIISSNINHKEVGNIPFDTEQLLTKEQVEELYFNSPMYKTDYKDETQDINLTQNIIDSNMIVLGNQENINSNITLNSSIMAENDINIKGQVQNSQDSVIYSVDGNITIEASTISYVGIIYAPNGKVTLSGTNVNINGTVIAKEIEINADNVNFNIIQFNTDTTKSLSRFQLFLANIFYDNKVNIVDLIIMKKKILGII